MLKVLLKLKKKDLVSHGVKKNTLPYSETLETASERTFEPLLCCIKDSEGIKEPMNAASLK